MRRFAATFERQIWANRRGNMVVELAFVIPVLVILVLGIYDFGRMALHQITLSSAVRAGAQYGTQDVISAADINGIIQAARDDANDDTLDVTARQYCSCPGVGETACSVTCPDGEFTFLYLDVTAQDQYAFLFDYPGISSPKTMTSSTRMRVR